MLRAAAFLLALGAADAFIPTSRVHRGVQLQSTLDPLASWGERVQVSTTDMNMRFTESSNDWNADDTKTGVGAVSTDRGFAGVASPIGGVWDARRQVSTTDMNMRFTESSNDWNADNTKTGVGAVSTDRGFA